MQTLVEMTAQIGETCVQDIPLINYSNKDWKINAQIVNTGKAGPNCFAGPVKDILVRAQYFSKSGPRPPTR